MTWAMAAGAAVSLVGGIMGSKSKEKAAKQAAEDAKKMREADIQEENRRYGETLRDNRANQKTAYGDLTWSTGPDGRPVQTVSMNPEDEKRLGSIRQNEQHQMDRANAGYNVDWAGAGYGDLAKWAGINGPSAGGAAINGPPQEGMAPPGTPQQASRMPVPAGGPQLGQQVSEQQAGGMAPPTPEELEAKRREQEIMQANMAMAGGANQGGGA